MEQGALNQPVVSNQAVVGLIAHVDAGKTSLAEAMLYEAGAIRRLGRVDHGDVHLDTDARERARKITIFSHAASLEVGDLHMTLLDAPGHVDFSAEAERTLRALDYAVLVVSATDGVEPHTETMWELLERYRVPAIVFANKMDIAGAAPGEVLADLRRRLSDSLVDAASLLSGGAAVEDAAATDEAALDEYLEAGALSDATLGRLVASRRVFPVFFGSALRDEGVAALLDGVRRLAVRRAWPERFAARVFKVSRGSRGERLAWLKVTGGALRAKDVISGADGRGAWEEKVDQVRVYDADSYRTVAEVPAGGVCAVTGLTRVVPGSALGAEPEPERPVLAPVLSYQVVPEGCDEHALARALGKLADEDPMLGFTWDADLGEARVQLMGAVQREVLRDVLGERYGLEVTFGPGGILYAETVAEPVEGVGHFEPLRHYAEVRLLVEPLPRGSGVVAGTRCPEDELDRNWQRLILTHVVERRHRGTLTGAPLDDVRITLVAGRAHAKHTEGGDFRQATYRAIRQALMVARERGAMRLLEPWYRFELAVPADKVGRALSDLQRMTATFDPPAVEGDRARIAGRVPASEVGEYALEVAGYTGGRGSIRLEFCGYDACHDADEVVARAAYDPVADVADTPDSVFCSHGAGHPVSWREVPDRAHTAWDESRLRPWRAADASFFSDAAS